VKFYDRRIFIGLDEEQSFKPYYTNS
jgi:hypothetical protein